MEVIGKGRIPAWPVALVLLLVPLPARPDCILDVTQNSDPAFSGATLFPNWVRAPAASFAILECDDLTCSASPNLPLTGLTILNYGSATGGAAGDVTGVYAQIVCGKTDSGLLAMAYAGIWTVAGSPRHAWTWAGSLGWSADPCAAPTNGCLCQVPLYVYADVGSCPTNGATVQFGPGFDDLLTPLSPGGVRDAGNCAGPWAKTVEPAVKTIRYVVTKADRDAVAPGDPVTYTVYFGRPGAALINTLWITDTLPAYTHVAGFGLPAPDPGWDPDAGPPARLRWTIPGPLPPAGGATGAVSFTVTVDWGNGEGFEPGSGDLAAPEGSFLFNAAHLAWDPGLGPGSCAPGRASNAASTVVKRYLFWLIGDNDVLFAPRLGQPDDEIIYELFVKSLSATRTWWDVRLWDTVPSPIDPWTPGFGFDDPCAGWTMTPTGCAAAAPGWLAAGADTLLTWKLDLTPGATITVRWKGRVRTTATVGAVVSSGGAIRAFGRPGVVGGTGDALAPRWFTHEATLILRTTYVSYVAWAGDDSAFFSCNGFTYWISFYPLNKAADFALYKKWCCGGAPCDTTCAGFATNGGVSPRIDVFAGTCTGGPPLDWAPGCMAERAPAQYLPNQFSATLVPPQPHHFLHKMVSNSPVLWELSTCGPKNSADADTYVGASSLTFAGYITYTYLRLNTNNTPPQFWDSLHLVNTDDAAPTTFFAFRWDAAGRSWAYFTDQDVYAGSQWTFAPGIPDLPNHFRVISSATRLVAHKAFVGLTAGGAYNDLGTLAPNRENGNLVNAGTPATFYLFAGHLPGASDVAMVGNVGAAKATYEVWVYAPLDPTAPIPYVQNVSPDLVGYAGSWAKVATHTVAATAPLPGPPGNNPHVYGDAYDACCFLNTYRLYKVVLLSGGPVQTYTGRSIMDRYSGGSMLHAAFPPGQQTGTRYWMHTNLPDHTVAGCDAIMTLDAFSPKTNLGINLASTDGAFATYTTNDVDECVSFRALSAPAKAQVRNWRMEVQAGGNPGDVMAQYIACNLAEKFYTAPFLTRGTYYDVLVPPVVFTGQSFWLTVVVMQSGTTRVDYCGTSAFTSTDPSASVQAAPMGGYSFMWTSGPGTCSAPPDEDGVHLFVNVVFTRLGLQTIVVSDTVDGSIMGLATVMVVGADVKLAKEPRFAVAASGDTVRFRICWSNYSSASAFTFTVTDAVPVGTTFLPEASTAGLDCGNTDGVPVIVASSTATSTTPPTTWTGGIPAAGTRWLRFTVPVAGVGTTGCACFRVTVN